MTPEQIREFNRVAKGTPMSKTHDVSTLGWIVVIIFSCIMVYCVVNSEDGAVTRVDGCQYLRFYTGRGFDYTHKGDCDNPIHYKK